MSEGVLVVGASLAGAHTALGLRRSGYDGPVTLVGAEPELPYERPDLSKGYLKGQLDRSKLLVATAEQYAADGITLRLGVAATGLDLDRRTVALADGDRLGFDTLVLATGSVNLRPPIPGADLLGVHQLRDLADADALASAAATARHAVVVGMGLVGCEVAATLRERGLEVTGVDALPGPLWRQVGPRLSDVVRGWHEAAGVHLRCPAGVASIDGTGSVERVTLADGSTLDADLVVVAVGARPATDWLLEAPLHLHHGAVGVDEQLRTQAAGVYAVGDLASVWDPQHGVHRRVEHYASAVDQAKRVAAVIAGADVPEPEAPWWWTVQHGRHLQVAGDLGAGQTLVGRTAPHAEFVLDGDVLVGVATIDNVRDRRRAMRLLGRAVDASVLADPQADVRTAA